MIQLPFIEVGNKPHNVFINCIVPDKDLIIYLGGGTLSHVGATALGVPRESLSGEGTSSSASVLCVTGHKEDLLAREIALRFSKKFNCVTTVITGLHIDDASKEDIKLLELNSKIAIDMLEKELLTKL